MIKAKNAPAAFGQKKYGYLTIKGFSHKDKKSRTYVNCVCDCGKKKTMRLSDLKRDDDRVVKSCGCHLVRNSQQTSQQALKIEKLINDICIMFYGNINFEETEHNYYVGRDCVDIAIPSAKICVEYNSHYFHRVKKDRSRQDRNKVRRLNRAGWKVVIVQGNREVPSQSSLIKAIKELRLRKKHKQRTITLRDWK